MKRVAILQSNYIPWIGYFNIIDKVDLFIFHDDIQYTKNDWRNRNKIKTIKGLEWLTIPCGTNINRLICEVELNEYSWQKKHWERIILNYRKAPYFGHYKHFFEDIYLNKNWGNLSALNQYIIKKISSEILHVKTKFDDSRNYNLTSHKEERVIELLQKTSATEYVSGPTARNYLHESEFRRVGIKLTWMDYIGYRGYEQLFPPFELKVSIIDLIFNQGPNAKDFLK